MYLGRVLIVGMILILTICDTGFAAEVGEKCPTFILKSMDGKEIQSAGIKSDNPLFLLFWSTWCPGCKDKIPKLKKISSQFTSKGLQVLAVNVGINDSPEKVRRFMKKYKIDYPVAIDEGSHVTKLFRIQGIPTVVIIDKEGIIRYRAHEIPKNFTVLCESLIK